MTGVIFQLKSDGDYYKLQDHDCFNASKISIFSFFFFVTRPIKLIDENFMPRRYIFSSVIILKIWSATEYHHH